MRQNIHSIKIALDFCASGDKCIKFFDTCTSVIKKLEKRSKKEKVIIVVDLENRFNKTKGLAINSAVSVVSDALFTLKNFLIKVTLAPGLVPWRLSKK